MATYAQLQSESWWGREVITPELTWLGNELCAALGVGRDHFGSKGDNAHLNGGHRSQEWIKNSRYCTNRNYTTVAGLNPEQARHIAALDITPANLDQMLRICRNLDRVVRAGQLEEIVEWYGNTNNDQRVDGWNNIKNAVASSDSSHLWHAHLTFDRRVLRDMGVMRRVLNALLNGTGTPPVTESAPVAEPQPQKEDDVMKLVGLFAKAAADKPNTWVFYGYTPNGDKVWRQYTSQNLGTANGVAFGSTTECSHAEIAGEKTRFEAE